MGYYFQNEPKNIHNTINKLFIYYSQSDPMGTDRQTDKWTDCDNIHSWISLSGDLAFSHQDGIYGFTFPKRFLEISSQRSHSFLNPNHLRSDYQSIGALSFCIRKAQCLANSSQTFSQFIRPSSLLSYTSK